MTEQPRPSSALERDLRHFHAQAQATVNDPALRAEHELWVRLAGEVEAYLRPPAPEPSLFSLPADPNELLTDAERRELNDDLARMARNRRNAEAESRDIPLGGQGFEP